MPYFPQCVLVVTYSRSYLAVNDSTTFFTRQIGVDNLNVTSIYAELKSFMQCEFC